MTSHYQRAVKNSSAVQYSNSRIDTPVEFEDAFKVWFSSTGFHPEKSNLTISQAQVFVKKVMQELGYK